MLKLLLVPILILSATSVAVADPQDEINYMREFSGKLSDCVVAASTLVGDRAEAAKNKRILNQVLDAQEKQYKCKARKIVEIDSTNRSIVVAFISKTTPGIVFIVVAQNGNLIFEQATIGGFRVVNIDPYGVDH